MANLLKWAKDRAGNVAHVAQAVERQVNPWDSGATAGNAHPQQQPQQQNSFTNNPVTRGFSRTVDQFNPLDSGRTWQHPMPTHPQGDSIIHQLSHNGITNATGDLLVKPFVINPAQNVVETGRMAVADATGNVAAQNASKTREWKNLKSSIPGFFGQQIWNTADVAKRLPQAIQSDVMGGSLLPNNGGAAGQVGFAASNPLGFALDKFGYHPHAPTQGQQENLNAGLKSFQDTPMGMVSRPVEKVAAQSNADARQTLGQAGFNPNEGWFKTAVLDPAQGVLTAEGIKGGVKGAVEPTKQLFRDSAGVVKNTASNLSPTAVAAQHPAVLALDDHINMLNQQRGNLLNQGLGENHPSVVQNGNAFRDAIQARNATVQQVAQGGYVKVPGKGDTPTEKLSIKNAPGVPGIKDTSKSSGFTQGATRSGEVSPELKTKLKDNPAGYDPVHNPDQIAASEAFLKKNRSLNKSVSDVQSRLNAKNGTIDNQTVSDTIATIKALDGKGGEANWQQASDLTNHLSEHLTAAGQTVQAARLLSNRTPEGMLYGARKALNKAGIEITPALQKALQDKVNEIKSLPEGEGKQYKIAELAQMVNKEIPSSFADKAVSVWKAGLLTGIKTQTGNILSNLTNIGLKTASNPIAATIDQGLTVLGKSEVGKKLGLTGERSKTFTLRGDATGAVEGIQKGWKSLKTGIDERQLEHIKFDTKQVNFGKSIGGRAAQRYVDTVFGLMGAADRPYYYSQLRNNLHDLAKADAINKGLKGAERESHIQKFIKDPPTEAFQTATNAAEKSIFANDTALSKIAGGVRNAVQDKPLASAAVNVIMPFTKVPSAVITRMVDYTPVGAVKTLVGAIKDVKKTGVLDQRAFSEGMAEAGVGTGAIFIGHQLAQNGLMTGNYPTDPTEQELWKLEGKQANSIKVGGKWLSMNYASPAGQLMQTGAQIHEAQKQGQGGAGLLGTAAAGTGKTILNQSFLQGVQGPLDALNDPQRSASKYIKQQAGSVVPTLVGDIAKATDPNQRQSNSVPDAIKAKIPGLNQTLLPKQDAFGRPLARPSSSVNTLVNPFRPSDVKNPTPLTSELQRLQDAGVGVMPDPSQKTLTVGKDKIKLTPQQLFDKNNKVGSQVLDAWNKITTDPGYSKLSDEEKQKALRNSLSDINAVQKADFVATNRQDLFGGIKLTKDQRKIVQNQSGVSPTDYLSATGSTGLLKDLPKNISGDSKSVLSQYDTMSSDDRKKAFNTQKDAEYKLAAAQFEKDNLNGTMTTAERIRRQNEVDKLKVGSAYDKNTRDIHSLGKQDVWDLVSSDKNGQAIVDQLIAYDDALVKAGVQTKSKFRDKYGNVAIEPKQAGSGRARKGRKAGRWAGIYRAPQGKSSTTSLAGFNKLMSGTVVKGRTIAAPKFAQTKSRKAVTVKV